MPTCSPSAALLKVRAVCMSRQSQILFLSDVGIFIYIVHAWCVTQTRPRFNVPSERRGVTRFSNTKTHRCTMPGPGIEPGPFLWKARVLTTRPLRPIVYVYCVYVCVCVCVCRFVFECVCVCLCVCLFVYVAALLGLQFNFSWDWNQTLCEI